MKEEAKTMPKDQGAGEEMEIVSYGFTILIKRSYAVALCSMSMGSAKWIRRNE